MVPQVSNRKLIHDLLPTPMIFCDLQDFELLQIFKYTNTCITVHSVQHITNVNNALSAIAIFLVTAVKE